MLMIFLEKNEEGDSHSLERLEKSVMDEILQDERADTLMPR